jgi:Na+/proline symporter
VLGLVSYAWAGFGAAFGPVVLFSVMWSRMTRNGALAGMVIGALTVIVWKQFGWLGLYEIIPGFIFGSIGIVVFSLLDKAPSPACSSASPKRTPITIAAAGTRHRRVRSDAHKPALAGFLLPVAGPEYYNPC